MAAIDDLLSQLARMISDCLGDDLVGIYRYGSSVLGAYTPGTSDIDVTVLCRVTLTPAQVTALARVYEQLIAAVPLARTLDVNHVPLAQVGGYHNPANPYCREGRFFPTGGGDVNPVMWHLVRTRGVVLFGPAAEQVIPPVSRATLDDNMRRNIAFLRGRMPAYVASGTEDVIFGVLSLCRALYTLQTGEIVSKVAAGRWALAHVDTPWRPMLARAVDMYVHGGAEDRLLTGRAEAFARHVADAVG